MPRCPKPEDSHITGGNSKDVQDGICEAIAALEKEFDAISTALMGTEEFARTATLISSVRMRLQKRLDGHMASQLERFNLPSRDDITALGERIMNIDHRLMRIEEQLQRVGPQQKPSPARRPARTKKPKSRSGDASSSKASKTQSQAPKPGPQK